MIQFLPTIRFRIAALLTLLLSLLSVQSQATVTVNASLVDPSGNTVPISFLRLQLRFCGYNIPDVPSAPNSIVLKQIDVPVSQLPVTIYASNEITCGNSYSTLWHITAFSDSRTPILGDYDYQLIAGTSFNLATGQPFTGQPPPPGFRPIFGNPTQSQILTQPNGTSLVFNGSGLFDFSGATLLMPQKADLLNGLVPSAELGTGGTNSGQKCLLDNQTFGTCPSAIVSGNATSLQGNPISASTPSSNQFLEFVGGVWTPSSVNTANATSLQGVAISATPPTSSQCLVFGTTWAPGPCSTGSANATSIQSNSVTGGAFTIPGQQYTVNPGVTALTLQTKIAYDLRDYLACDGSTDDTAALGTLLATIGSTPAKLTYPKSAGPCVLANVSIPANVTHDFSPGGRIQALTSAVSPGSGGFVQAHGTNNSTTLTGSCAVSLSGVASGNAILFYVQQYNGDSITRTALTPSDGGDTYVPIFATDTSHASRAYAWVAANVTAGSKTITSTISTPSTNQQNFCMAMEVSGVGSTPKAYFANGTGTGGTTLSSGSTTMPAGTFLAAFGGQPYVNETSTPGAGYTQPASDGGSLSGQTNNGSPGGPGESLASEYLASSAGGSTSATITVNNTITRSDTSPGFWMMNLVGLAPGSATINILGQIVNPDLHQIFYNALGGSQGAIDFTGGTSLSPVFPEWWGASPQASAATNTPAIQAAIWGAFGCGPVLCRTNPSGLRQYNRELHFSGFYNINGELQVYHMIGFHWTGAGMNNSGLVQNAANSRIIDGENIAYGAFDNMSFSAAASEDASHPLIDFESGQQGVDIFHQFVTFNSDLINCNGVGAIGVEISPNGESNGNNFNFNNVAGKSCTQAVAQIGNVSNNAFNALSNIWVGGDIQGAPQYGLAAYGGQWLVKGTTFEDGTTGQTGFDLFCSTTQYPCAMDNVRSESFHLFASQYPVIKDSQTIFQGVTWDQANLAGTAGGLGQLLTGDSASGDGGYYQVTVAGTWGGLNNTTATSGTATTIVCSGCTWTVNQWAGMHVGIVSGTGTGAYGIVTSNTATTITVPSWINNTPIQTSGFAAAPPDSTSHFVIEPNWGTQTTSGSVTFAAVTGFVVDGTSGTPAAHADIQNSQLIGFPINVTGNSVRDTIFSRRDWLPTSASTNTILPRNFTGNSVILPLQGGLAPNGEPQTYQSSTSTNAYVGQGQWNLGTFPVVWSCSSARGGGAICNDTWIGGRSDPAAGTSVSRNIMEFGGMLGRPTPFLQTNANGLPTQIEGGLSTGTGTPGNIEFWIGGSGSSGSAVNVGTKVLSITPAGLQFSSTNAGEIDLNQGPLASPIANTVGIAAPASVPTAYQVVLPSAASTGIPHWTNTAGIVQWTTAPVSLSADVTGNLPVTNLNGGAAASSSTFWRGDGVWATASGSGSLPSGLTFSLPTFTISSATNGNGVMCLSGNTSGTACLTAPAIAGTSTNPIVFSNVIQVPIGSLSAAAIQLGAANTGLFGGTNVFSATANGTSIINYSATAQEMATALVLGWSSTSSPVGTIDTTLCRISAGLVEIGAATGCAASGSLNLTNLTAKGTITVNGSSSGTATLNASATGSLLQLNGASATVDTSGNLTVATCTGCTAGGSVPASAAVLGSTSGSAFVAATSHGIVAPLLCLDTSGSGTAQLCTTSPTFVPASGDSIIYESTTTNTGDVTINVNSSSAIHARKWQGTATLAAGDLQAGSYILATYDGTFWEMATIGNAPAGLNVNGSGVSAPNFNGSTPAAQAGFTNATFQVSGSSISAEVPTPGPTFAGTAWFPFYSVAVGNQGNSTVVPTSANAPQLGGFLLQSPAKLSNLGVDVVTGVGAATCDVGIYGPTIASSTTASLAAHTGSFACATSTTEVNTAISGGAVNLQPGWYYLAWCSSSATVALGSPMGSLGLMGGASAPLAKVAGHDSAGGDACTAGVLPSSFTLSNITGDSKPLPLVAATN